MGFKGEKQGPNRKSYFIVCSWCGRGHRQARPGGLTCSPKCKLRMFRFKSFTGFDPEHPPGDLTTHQAIDVLIQELVRRERVRIEAESEKIKRAALVTRRAK